MSIQAVKINRNNAINSFSAKTDKKRTETQYPVITIQKGDVVSSKPAESGGFWQGVTGVAVNFNKVTVAIEEYSSALIFGTFKGAIVAGLAFLGINKINYFKNMKRLASKDAKMTASIAVGALSLALSLFNARLNVNQRTAMVDYRWNVKKQG